MVVEMFDDDVAPHDGAALFHRVFPVAVCPDAKGQKPYPKERHMRPQLTMRCRLCRRTLDPSTWPLSTVSRGRLLCKRFRPPRTSGLLAQAAARLRQAPGHLPDVSALTGTAAR